MNARHFRNISKSWTNCPRLPDLRKKAITRVYDAALADAGIAARVQSVFEDKKRGLVAKLEKTGEVEQRDVIAVMGNYTRPWEWA